MPPSRQRRTRPSQSCTPLTTNFPTPNDTHQEKEPTTSVIFRVYKKGREGYSLDNLDKQELKVDIPSSVCLATTAPGKWELWVSRSLEPPNVLWRRYRGWLQSPSPAQNKVPVIVKLAANPRPWGGEGDRRKYPGDIRRDAEIVTGPLRDLQGKTVARYYGLNTIWSPRDRKDITVSVQQWVGEDICFGEDMHDLDRLTPREREETIHLLNELHAHKVVHNYPNPRSIVRWEAANKLVERAMNPWPVSGDKSKTWLKNNTHTLPSPPGPPGMEQGKEGTLAMIDFDQALRNVTPHMVQYDLEVVKWAMERGDTAPHLKVEHEGCDLFHNDSPVNHVDILRCPSCVYWLAEEIRNMTIGPNDDHLLDLRAALCDRTQSERLP